MRQPDANQNTNNNSSEHHFTGNSDLNQANNTIMPHQTRLKMQNGNYRRLIEACKRKDLGSIKSILAEQPELANQKDKQNRTLLHYSVILMLDDDDDDDEKEDGNNAAYDNSTEAAKSFGQIQQPPPVGTTTASEILNLIECFDYLTSRCDIKLWWQQDSDGLSVLHMAVISSNVPMVEHIVYEHPYAMKYPLVSIRDHEHHSPLHWAVITNNLDSVKLLVNYAGTKLAQEPDLNGATPLHYATQTSDYPRYRQQLLSMLKSVGTGSSDRKNPSSRQQKCPVVNDENVAATNSLQETSDAKDSSEIHAQQQRTGGCNRRPLHSMASKDGCTSRGFEILEYLVKLPQINLECADRDQRTPLLWSASSGNCDAIELLLAHGANAFSCDANRLGALHCAASHGFTDCLESLLAAGSGAGSNNRPVDPNQVDNLNCTPLFYSVLSGNVDCVETLLDHGAHADWQDSKGRTAAHFAALKGQLGALKLLQRRGANLWLANKQGDLPLHYAIKSGRLQVVRWLMEHSPYERAVNAINNFGRAPIHLAIARDNVQLVDYLIRSGANLNQLVKMRNKHTKVAKLAGSSGVAEAQASSDTSVGALRNTSGGKNGKINLYHYETALDMAKHLNHKECLQLLEENQAKSAAQVISGRQQRGSFGPSHSGRSIFDTRSIEGPSPIGFETSCSSASPNTASQMTANMASDQLGRRAATDADGRAPKLRRPAPDSLPGTDSTASSSALSQNSLTSVRGVERTPLNEPRARVCEAAGQQEAGCDENCAKDSGAAPRSLNCREGNSAPRPYRGGISYNNEHICASIKCKLYDRNQGQFCAGARGHLATQPCGSSQEGDTMGPPDGEPSRSHWEQRALQAAHSAPVQSCWRAGQEIVTNVNVYTSPCPHCMLQSRPANRNCLECHRSSQRQLVDERAFAAGHSRQLTEAGQQAGRSTRGAACSADEDEYDADGTSDEPSGSENENGQEDDDGRLPKLAGSAATNAGNLGRLRYLPPSQRHDQHLPVIMSDREQSTSVTSNEQQERDEHEVDASSDRDDDDDDDGDKQDRASQAGRDLAQENLRMNDNLKSGNIKRRLMSPALEEPRFDRSQAVAGNSSTNRAARLHDRHVNQIKSPVAEYIRGDGPKFTQHRRPEEGSRASRRAAQACSGGQQVTTSRSKSSQRLPDFSHVRPRVDSNRFQLASGDFGPYNAEPHASRSKSMSVLSHGESHGLPCHGLHQPKSPQPTKSEMGSRSVSRQTIIKTRRLSVDSVELATRVEKAIRKYRFETKLFEELQNLKRSQIRSGRANEALLVKRLVEHLRQDTRDLIGLDTYQGPYTYKSYERFLYDQLRKLSQSNCAKLSRHQAPYRYTLEKYPGDDTNYDDDREQQSTNYLEEDLRADMELRRIIGGENQEEHRSGQHSGDDESDMESYVLEPSGALEEIRVKGTDLGEAQESARMQQPRDGAGSVSQRETMQIVHMSTTNDDAPEELPPILKFDERPQVEELGKEVARPGEAQEAKAEDKPEVGKETTPNDIEDEAKSMSSAIIVDALGNISRVGSLNDLDQLSGDRREEEATNLNGDDGASHETKSANIGDDLDGERIEPEAATGKPPIDTGDSYSNNKQSRGRRRSIVNIGNKVECIYHDVGIEIDPAPEVDPAKLEEQEAETGGKVVEEEVVVSKSAGDRSSGRLEDVTEEMDGEKPELEPSEAQDSPEVKSEVDDGLSHGSEFADGPATAAVDTIHGSSGEEAATFAGSNLASSIQPRKRRASSPPACSVTGSSRGSGRDPKNLSKCSSFSGSDATSSGRLTKSKVFNGYDLDALHQERIRSRGISSVATIERVVEAEGLSSLNDDGDQDHRESAESGDSDAIRHLNNSDKTSKDEKEAAEDHDDDKREKMDSACRKPVGRTTLKRRLKRTKLRKVELKYKPQVPLEEIKRRWSQIKAQERSKLSRALGDVELIDIRESQEEAARLQAAKSQPNLKPHNDRKDEDRQQFDRPTTNRFLQQSSSSYTLLYEINEAMRGHSCGMAKVGARKSSRWCQKIAAQIVDVRTVKRTLSLPETVMYSNDLMKRFNILKL